MSMKHKIQHLRTVSRKLQQITQDMLIFRGEFLYPENIKPDAIQDHSQNCTIEGNRNY
jgi:hypothetical protein